MTNKPRRDVSRRDALLRARHALQTPQTSQTPRGATRASYTRDLCIISHRLAATERRAANGPRRALFRLPCVLARAHIHTDYNGLYLHKLAPCARRAERGPTQTCIRARVCAYQTGTREGAEEHSQRPLLRGATRTAQVLTQPHALLLRTGTDAALRSTSQMICARARARGGAHTHAASESAALR
eukprot:IDg22663t1